MSVSHLMIVLEISQTNTNTLPVSPKGYIKPNVLSSEGW